MKKFLRSFLIIFILMFSFPAAAMATESAATESSGSQKTDTNQHEVMGNSEDGYYTENGQEFVEGNIVASGPEERINRETAESQKSEDEEETSTSDTASEETTDTDTLEDGNTVDEDSDLLTGELTDDEDIQTTDELEESGNTATVEYYNDTSFDKQTFKQSSFKILRTLGIFGIICVVGLLVIYGMHRSGKFNF